MADANRVIGHLKAQVGELSAQLAIVAAELEETREQLTAASLAAGAALEPAAEPAE